MNNFKFWTIKAFSEVRKKVISKQLFQETTNEYVSKMKGVNQGRRRHRLWETSRSESERDPPETDRIVNGFECIERRLTKLGRLCV